MRARGGRPTDQAEHVSSNMDARFTGYSTELWISSEDQKLEIWDSGCTTEDNG